MFDRIKKALSKSSREPGESVSPSSQMAQGPVSEWAATRGFGFTVDDKGQGVAVEGHIRGKPWRLQLGTPSREYIRGEEIRARGELGINEDIAVLVMNKPLKEALEKQAYAMYTDSLQTSADPRLPEEMRWLAMFDEVGWEDLPPAFWDRYSVLSDNRDHAIGWVNAELAEQLLNWPDAATNAEVPFMMLLLRGKAYLRMEYSPAELITLQHASAVFTTACEAALDAPAAK
jgi:hypothetical protein